MSALNWIRNRTQPAYNDVMVVTDEQATDDCPAGTYDIVSVKFEGMLPYRMMQEVKRSVRDLINTETEVEVLRLGNGYVSGQNICRYSRTTYTRRAGA